MSAPFVAREAFDAALPRLASARKKISIRIHADGVAVAMTLVRRKFGEVRWREAVMWLEVERGIS